MNMKGALIAMIKNPTEFRRPPTTLRFSPTAWAKLLFLRDVGDTEIGGFAITPSDDYLFVEDVQLVSQHCSAISVEFEDQAVADFFDRQVDQGRRPEQFARIWVHTHPANSAQPSGTDERTFARVFGRSDWAVMFILARGGDCFARLRYNVGPGSDVELKIEIEYDWPFSATDYESWREEYLAHVGRPPAESPTLSEFTMPVDREHRELDDWWRDAWSDYADIDENHQETLHGYGRDF
jgi:hypothetical protein